MGDEFALETIRSDELRSYIPDYLWAINYWARKRISSKEYFLRFSHNLIFSFNRKSVNIVYKIENIKGPACVQRQGQGQSKSWPMKSVWLLVGWLFCLFNAITNLFHIDHNHIWLVDQEQFLDCPVPPSSPVFAQRAYFLLFTRPSTCPLGSFWIRVCSCTRRQTPRNWREVPPLGLDRGCARCKEQISMFAYID